MIEPNLIALMTDAEMDTMIPEKLKKTAWQRYLDENGNLAYSQRTWRDMTEDVHYIGWYGTTAVFKNALFRGERVGDRHLVKGKLSLHVDDFEALGSLGLTLMTSSELLDFYKDNT